MHRQDRFRFLKHLLDQDPAVDDSRIRILVFYLLGQFPCNEVAFVNAKCSEYRANTRKGPTHIPEFRDAVINPSVLLFKGPAQGLFHLAHGVSQNME